MAMVSEPSVVDTEDLAHLTPVGRRVPIREYLGELWERREFATVVPLRDMSAEHMDTVLGNLWHLVNPLLLVSVYYVMFGLILELDRGVENFVGFLVVGVFGFHFTQKSVRFGARSIVSNRELIRSIQFPRALLPVSSTVGQTLAFAPAAAVMLVVVLATGESLRLVWLLLLPLWLWQALFNLGATLVASRVTVLFKDFDNMLPHAFRVLFYLSGTLYPVDRFIKSDLARNLFEVNPLYSFVSLTRGVVLESPVTAGMMISVVVWTAVLLIGGFAFFLAGERSYGSG